MEPAPTLTAGSYLPARSNGRAGLRALLFGAVTALSGASVASADAAHAAFARESKAHLEGAWRIQIDRPTRSEPELEATLESHGCPRGWVVALGDGRIVSDCSARCRVPLLIEPRNAPNATTDTATRATPVAVASRGPATQGTPDAPVPLERLRLVAVHRSGAVVSFEPRLDPDGPDVRSQLAGHTLVAMWTGESMTDSRSSSGALGRSQKRAGLGVAFGAQRSTSTQSGRAKQSQTAPGLRLQGWLEPMESLPLRLESVLTAWMLPLGVSPSGEGLRYLNADLAAQWRWRLAGRWLLASTGAGAGLRTTLVGATTRGYRRLVGPLLSAGLTLEPPGRTSYGLYTQLVPVLENGLRLSGNQLEWTLGVEWLHGRTPRTWWLWYEYVSLKAGRALVRFGLSGHSLGFGIRF